MVTLITEQGLKSKNFEKLINYRFPKIYCIGLIYETVLTYPTGTESDYP